MKKGYKKIDKCYSSKYFCNLLKLKDLMEDEFLEEYKIGTLDYNEMFFDELESNKSFCYIHLSKNKEDVIYVTKKDISKFLTTENYDLYFKNK